MLCKLQINAVLTAYFMSLSYSYAGYAAYGDYGDYAPRYGNIHDHR
jgi:hypothetical protein